MLAKTAASRPSSMILKPPLMLLLSHFTGHGFLASKKVKKRSTKNQGAENNDSIGEGLPKKSGKNHMIRNAANDISVSRAYLILPINPKVTINSSNFLLGII